jgi:integrase
MALYKRGGTWWFEFRYRGRRYQESAGTNSKTLAIEIQRKRRRAVEEAANGIRRVRDGAVLFSVAATEWLKAMEATWAPKTHVNASLDVGHLKSHFGSHLLVDISAATIADYVKARRTQKAADKTIRNELGTLRGVLKHFRLWSALKDDGVRLPRAQESDTGIALTHEQEAALLIACAASRSRSLLPAVTLALSTGLRHDELRLLRWRQIDFTHRAVRVGRSKTQAGAGRSVHLNHRALAALKDWAAQFPDRKPTHFVFPSERVGFSGDDEIPQVFDTDPTKAITSWKTAWGSAKESAGIECRFHDLRHTAVTRLLEAGEPFAVVADIMGWSAATTVRMAKRYAHIGDSSRRRAMAALDAPGAPAEAASATSTLVPPSTTIQ